MHEQGLGADACDTWCATYMDVAPDEALDMLKRRSMHKWDARKKKYVRETLGQVGAVADLLPSRGGKRQRDESGNVISAKKGKDGDQDEMRAMLQERSALEQSNSMMDDILAQGRATYGNLVNQNTTLKNARKKLLDAANAIGVSSSLVNIIDLLFDSLFNQQLDWIANKLTMLLHEILQAAFLKILLHILLQL